MNKRFLFFITFLSIVVGTIFYCIQQRMLIISWTGYKPLGQQILQTLSQEKKVSLFFWQEEKFYAEQMTIPWYQDNVEKNVHTLINNWLAHLQEERLISQKIQLESVALDVHQQEAYCSFNQAFLSQEWSISKKWHFIESLCKTLREARIPIRFIVFIVNDAIMKDDHLDFSQPWPIDGFLEDVIH